MSAPAGKAKVQLNPCDNSLNCEITNEGLALSSLSEGGFGYMFGGARANVGVLAGRWCFHLRVTGAQAVNVRDTDLLRTSVVVRVGVSQANTPVGRLGETKDGISVGYNSTGKKVSAHTFSAYGATWAASREALTRDIITVLVDLESDGNEARVSWARNGAWQGKGFSVPKPSGPEGALFPHVLVRNCTVLLDFQSGQPPHMGSIDVASGGKPFRPWAAALRDPSSSCAAPGWPPKPAAECEAVMLVGLPGSGKTTWAASEVAQHPAKHYTVLSPDACLDAMRLLGLKGKRGGAAGAGAAGAGTGAAQAGAAGAAAAAGTTGGGGATGEGGEGAELEHYYALGAAVFNALLERAPRVARNYILDQAHVSPAKRTARLAPFRAAGFRLRAALAAPFPMWLHMMQEQGSVGPPGGAVHKLGMRLVADEVMASLLAEFEVPLPGGPEGFTDVTLVHPPPDAYFDDEAAGEDGGTVKQEQGQAGPQEEKLAVQLARIERVIVSKQREQGRRWLARQGIPGPPPASPPAPCTSGSGAPGTQLQQPAPAAPITSPSPASGAPAAGGLQGPGLAVGAGGMGPGMQAGLGFDANQLEWLTMLPPDVLSQVLTAAQAELEGQQQGGVAGDGGGGGAGAAG